MEKLHSPYLHDNRQSASFGPNPCGLPLRPDTEVRVLHRLGPSGEIGLHVGPELVGRVFARFHRECQDASVRAAAIDL